MALLIQYLKRRGDNTVRFRRKVSLKRVTPLGLMAVIIIPVFLNLFCISNNALAVEFYDAGLSYRKKMMRNMISKCLSTESNLKSNGDWITMDGKIRVSSGDAIGENVFAGDFWNSGFGNSTVGWSWAEKTLVGDIEGDGMIWCGEKDNALLKEALDTWNININDFICNYTDNDLPGVLVPQSGTSASCWSSNAKYYHGSDDPTVYFDDLITAKAFNDIGFIPGGSISDFTDAEWYWFNYNTFKSSCAGEARDEGGFSIDHYTIADLTVADSPVKKEYGHRAGWWRADEGVVTSVDGGKTRCQDIADALAWGGTYSNAAIDLYNILVIEKCVEDFEGLIRGSRQRYNRMNIAINGDTTYYVGYVPDNLVEGLKSVLSNTNHYRGYLVGETPYNSLSTHDYFNSRVTVISEQYNEAVSELTAVLGGSNSPVNDSFSGGIGLLQTLFDGLSYDGVGNIATSMISEEQKSAFDEYITGMESEITRLNGPPGGLAEFLEYIEGQERKNKTNPGNDDSHIWYTDGNNIVVCNGVNTYKDPTMSEPGQFIPPPGVVTDPGVTDPGVSGDGEVCNAGVLGWIICPVIEILSGVMDWLYTGIVEPTLTIQTSLIGADDPDTGAFGAWNAFRNVANVVFVIFILIIVFSQITGIGITNYGIKNLLPKIIISAILVNVSYYVCQIAVDLSNILGYQIDTWLSSFATEPGYQIVTAGAVGWTGLGLAAIAAGAIVAWGMIGTILVAMLAGLVSLLLMFFILAARKAAIIVLVVVSPLAFICLLLPNTEGVFKKWFSVFKTLLLIYPICGFVIGAGTLAAGLISSTSSDDFVLNLTAALMSVLPFLAVPSITKGSLRVLGDLGGKINNRLGGISRWSGDKFRGSTAGRALSRRDTAVKSRRMTNDKSLRNRTLGKFYGSGIGRRLGLSGAYDRQRAAYVSEIDAQDEKDISAAGTLFTAQKSPDFMANGEKLSKEWFNAAVSGDENTQRFLQRKLSASGFDMGQLRGQLKELTSKENYSKYGNTAIDGALRTFGKDASLYRSKDAEMANFVSDIKSGSFEEYHNNKISNDKIKAMASDAIASSSSSFFKENLGTVMGGAKSNFSVEALNGIMDDKNLFSKLSPENQRQLKTMYDNYVENVAPVAPPPVKRNEHGEEIRPSGFILKP